MNVLLDTHAFLWFVWDDPQLSPTARKLIESTEEHVYLSVASCWEIAIKCGLKKLHLDTPALDFLRRELTLNSFSLLPISLEHAASVETLPLHHRDPFDRLIISQSILESAVLISCDEVFDQYDVHRIW